MSAVFRKSHPPGPSLAFRASGAPFDLASRFGEVGHFTRRGVKILISSAVAGIAWIAGLTAAGLPLAVSAFIGLAFAAGLYSLDKALNAPDPSDEAGRKARLAARGTTVLTGNTLVIHLALIAILPGPISTLLAENAQSQIDHLTISASHQRDLTAIDVQIADLDRDVKGATADYNAKVASQAAEELRGGCGDLCRRDGAQVDASAGVMRAAVIRRDVDQPKLRSKRDKMKAAAETDLALRAGRIRSSSSIVERISAADSLMFRDWTTGIGAALLLIFALALDSAPLIEALKTSETSTLRAMRRDKQLNDARTDALNNAMLDAIPKAVSELEPEMFLATVDAIKAGIQTAGPAAATAAAGLAIADGRSGSFRPSRTAKVAGATGLAAIAVLSGVVLTPQFGTRLPQSASSSTGVQRGERQVQGAQLASLSTACRSLSLNESALRGLGSAVQSLATANSTTGVTAVAARLRASAPSMPGSLRGQALAAASHLDALAAHGMKDRADALAAATALKNIGTRVNKPCALHT